MKKEVKYKFCIICGETRPKKCLPGCDDIKEIAKKIGTRTMFMLPKGTVVIVGKGDDRRVVWQGGPV